jgi:hypothetical protein
MVGEGLAMTNGVEKNRVDPYFNIDNFLNENLTMISYNGFISTIRRV